MNLRLMLEETTKQHGEKTAIALGEHRLSYAELHEASNKVANALIEMGVVKGDRVAMLLPNIPEFAVIYFGIVKAGGIAVPLDVRYKAEELIPLCASSAPKVMVTESSYLEPLMPALPQFKSIEHIIDMSSKYEGRFTSYQEIMNMPPAQKAGVELEPEDIAHITYASGAAAHPKGAALTHHGLITEAAIGANAFQQTYKDIEMLYSLPMCRTFGLVAIMLTSVYKGSTVVIAPGLSIDGCMELMEKERVTILMGVPSAFILAVELAEKEGVNYDLNSLRLCGSAGAPLAVDVVKQFKRHYGLDIINFWGLTESTALVTSQPIDGSGKVGAAGKVLPGWELKIVDEDGQEVPPNQPGEIIVRGPVMKGYYGNPQATAEVVRNGWLYTGDIGKVDEDGYLFILDKKKDMIIVAGQNIYPDDIEKVLYTHPKVAEAAVVGIPDKLRGEAVRAVIRLKEGAVASEREIKQFCRQRLADFKVPKQIIFMTSFPKTITGKIRKEVLKQAGIPDRACS